MFDAHLVERHPSFLKIKPNYQTINFKNQNKMDFLYIVDIIIDVNLIAN